MLSKKYQSCVLTGQQIPDNMDFIVAEYIGPDENVCDVIHIRNGSLVKVVDFDSNDNTAVVYLNDETIFGWIPCSKLSFKGFAIRYDKEVSC